MRIAIEAQRLFRPRKHGMDVVAYELLRRLPLRGDKHDYHVLVKDDIDKCISHIDARAVHTVQSAPYPVWEQALLPQYCNKMKADVLHCTANTAPLKMKQPLILTLHDVIFLQQSYAKASLYQRLGNRYRSTIVPSIAKKAARIITVSHYQKHIIAQTLSLPEDKISVVYNGADDRFFTIHKKEDIAAVSAEYHITPGYIFFMANTEPRKNTSGALRAYDLLVKQYPSAPRLVIKGLKEEQLIAMLAKEKLSHLKERIDLIGYVEYADLPLIYQGASMLWFPSFSEGFGLPIVEAMAGGVPVITSDASCMPEIAGNAALLINPHQPKTLAAAALQVLEEKAVALCLSERGKERAKFFTWDSAVEGLVKIYDEVEATM